MTSAQIVEESDAPAVDDTAVDEIPDDSVPTSTLSSVASTTTSQASTTTTTTTTEASDQAEQEPEQAEGGEDQTETENMQGDDPSAGVSASPGMLINFRKICMIRRKIVRLFQRFCGDRLQIFYFRPNITYSFITVVKIKP